MRLLITKELRTDQKHFLEQFNIEFDELRVLDFTFIQDKTDVINELTKPNKIIVFTSAKAFRALATEIVKTLKKEQLFYVVGTYTQFLLKQIGFQNVLCYPTSMDMAMQAKWEAGQGISYFAGDQTRGVLEKEWSRNSLDVEKVEVYRKTLLYPDFANNDYDSILFFSPSGVESYLRNNVIPTSKTVGSIGAFTSRALQSKGITNIVEADSPTFVSLIEKLNNTF